MHTERGGHVVRRTDTGEVSVHSKEAKDWKRGVGRPSLTALRRDQPCQYPTFEAGVSRTVRE